LNGASHNAAIEALWIHARCLLEFFWRVSQTEGRTSCAQDFTRKQLEYDLPFGTLEDSINNHICHLNYARFRNLADKIDGFTMQRVKEALERAVSLFQSNLKDDFEEIWTVRPDVNVINVATCDPSATNVVFSISTTNVTTLLPQNYLTGPSGPSKFWRD